MGHHAFTVDEANEMLPEVRATLSEIQEENRGLVTSMTLPSGGRIGLYQPTHPTALDID